jgi:hypothetical protein
MRSTFAATSLALALLSGAANASTISSLSDNFATENGGRGSLNYFGLADFTVTKGSVDLIGNGFFDNYPHHGLYIDLAGSTNQFGAITTKGTFGPANYVLTLDIGGPIYNGISDGAILTIGSNVFSTGDLAGLNEHVFTFDFTLQEAARLTIADAGHSGNANIGATLFDVSVVDPPSVSEPGTIVIFSASLLAIGFMRRQRSFFAGTRGRILPDAGKPMPSAAASRLT